MTDGKITISKPQAAALAAGLYSAVADFIAANRAEFEEWQRKKEVKQQ